MPSSGKWILSPQFAFQREMDQKKAEDDVRRAYVRNANTIASLKRKLIRARAQALDYSHQLRDGIAVVHETYAKKVDGLVFGFECAKEQLKVENFFNVRPCDCGVRRSSWGICHSVRPCYRFYLTSYGKWPSLGISCVRC